ncbi:hypothetical protein D9757_011922 [Collybiopsis confluens]|uniref:Uncharacterized protein n=1 Tax=Collybiopsis confluens TaxID=2823264 RepID=A0A8H5GKN4_9AGAR|nr:hypothetical protein D9757_011922 [Collybiopsis confluens]
MLACLNQELILHERMDRWSCYCCNTARTFTQMRETAYISLLASSLIATILLDIIVPKTSEQTVCMIEMLQIFWLPSMVGLSIWLLRRQKLPESSPLPLPACATGQASSEDGPSSADGLHSSITLMTFGYFYLISRRFLGVVSGCEPMPRSLQPSLFEERWPPLGITLSLLSVIAFGQCLLAFDASRLAVEVFQRRWGSTGHAHGKSV